VLYVPDVKCESLIPGNGIPPVNLSPPGNAWFDGMPLAFALSIIGKIPGQERTWTDQTHRPQKDIKELR
jgi:hypothetical protein